MTRHDLAAALRSLRPDGFTDALGANLAKQIVRNESLERLCAQQAREIARLVEDAAGYFEANGQAFAELARARQEIASLRYELAQARR